LDITKKEDSWRRFDFSNSNLKFKKNSN